MAFRKVKDVSPLIDVKYNTPEAGRFLNSYNNVVINSLMSKSKYTPSKSFAPSSIRCKRQQWFRLRGTAPDTVKEPDVTLNFIAGVGTYCHRSIQSMLSEYFKDSWIDVPDYLKNNPPEYKYSVVQDGFETKVTVEDPPVRFSCDGLVELDGTVYLLEIKTSEAVSMKSLVAPKPEHLDQVMCYCTLLGVNDALVLYQDRQYGSLKCFTYHVKDSDKQRIVSTFKEVQQCVENNLVPEALPVGDKWCNSSYCRYYRSCKKWGR